MNSYTLQMSLRQMSNYLCEVLKQKRPEVMKIKLASMQREEDFWNERLEVAKGEIEAIIEEMKRQDCKMIVTKEEEIVAMMVFFSGKKAHRLSNYRIINTDEKCLRYFPCTTKMYKDFFFAYCVENDEDMKKVYNEYIQTRIKIAKY